MLASLAISLTANAYTINWTGLGDGTSLFQRANWDADGVVRDVACPHDIIIGAAGTSVGPWSGTLDLGNTGTLTVTAAANSFTSSTGFSAITKNGTVTLARGDGNIRYGGVFDNADVTITAGVYNVQDGLRMINGSTLVADSMASANVSLNNGSTITLSGTTNVMTNIVDLLDAASTIVFSGLSIADVTNNYLGNITINGAAAVLGTNARIFTNNDGFTAIAVPEPATYALIFGCLALGFLMIRRRSEY